MTTINKAIEILAKSSSTGTKTPAPDPREAAFAHTLYPYRVEFTGGFACVTGQTSRVTDTTDHAVEILNEEVGEWSDWHKFGDVERRFKDAVRCWAAVQEFTMPAFYGIENWDVKEGDVIHPGQFLHEYRHNYFREYRGRAIEDHHDVCLYCGTDNGRCGEYRNGYDCCYCGGN